jgi:O-antigen/teichoic acid export membrane protein
MPSTSAVTLAALVVSLVGDAPATRARLALDPDVRLGDGGLRVERRDGALLIGDTRGVRVVGRVATPAEVRADDAAALAGDIAWSSAPPVGARARLAVDGASWRVAARAGDDPLILVGEHGAVVAADLEHASNRALLRWGYFAFALHAAVARAANRAPGAFADWPAAPVPHRGLIGAWLALTVGLGALYAFGLGVARRRARAEPDAHARLFAPLAAPPRAESGWSRPGIARPLGGFFLFLSATLLAMGPYLYLTAVLIPSRVQPFPDVDGLWAPVEELAMLAWSLAELGMTTAFVKRFAEHRVRDPTRALQAAQLYVWWQMGAGLALFAVGGGLACGLLPHTRWALLSRLVVLRAAMLVPGVLSLFSVFFQAAQRFDYQLGLDLLEKRLLIVLLPVPLVLWLRAWGRAHLEVGEATGALVGLAAGQYAAMATTCALGYALYRRLRLPLAPLFFAGFDRRTVGDLGRFGLGVVAGKAPFFAANAAEIAILTTLLPGYPTWLGIRQLLMSRLVFVLWFMWPFIDSGVPAFSEALAAGKRALARYYVVRYLQFGHLFAALVIAFLLGAGPPLLTLALSDEWRGAARYLPLAAATGVFLPAAWLADSFQKGAGRAGLNALLLIAEQSLRVGLFVLAVPRLGLVGVFVAIVVTMALKSTVAWWINHRLVGGLVLMPWTVVGAPAATGAALYGALVALAHLLPPTRAAGVALFAAGAIAAFPFGFFVAGLLGGFDAAALEELARAAQLASVMRPIAAVLARLGRAGARLCPLARPAPPLAAAAEREADEVVALEHR